MPLRHCTLHHFVPPVTSMAAARQALRVKARAAHLNLADSRAHLHLCLHRNKPRVASHSTAGRPLDCRSRLTEGSRAARRRELRRRNAGGRNPAGRRHHHSRARRGPAAPAPTPRAVARVAPAHAWQNAAVGLHQPCRLLEPLARCALALVGVPPERCRRPPPAVPAPRRVEPMARCLCRRAGAPPAIARAGE